MVMEREPIQDMPEAPVVKDVDFLTLILDVLGDQPPLVPEREETPEAGLWLRVVRASKRFASGAVSLSRAFVVSAATGKPANTYISPELLLLKQAMRELLDQLRWLEAGETVADPDDTLNTPQRQWAEKTLAVAVRLKILQRASHYCRLRGETSDNSTRLCQLLAMHSYYLDQFARLQRSPH